jgi:HEAT repeat protein
MSNFLRGIKELVNACPGESRIPAEQLADEIRKRRIRTYASAIHLLANRSTETNIRQFICNLVGYLHYRPAWATLLAIASDPSEVSELRMLAMSELGSVGCKLASKPLVQFLTSNETSELRARAALSLGWLCDVRAVSPLLQRVSDRAENEAVRVQSAEALGVMADMTDRFPHRQATDVLLGELAAASGSVKFGIVYALSTCGDERAIPSLEAVTKDKSFDDKVGHKKAIKEEAHFAILSIKRRVVLTGTPIIDHP